MIKLIKFRKINLVIVHGNFFNTELMYSVTVTGLVIQIFVFHYFDTL